MADGPTRHPGGEDGRGETVDIADLVREHHGAVYGYAYRLCGNAADAEDVSQQVFLIAQQKIEQLRDPRRTLGWLLTITRNCYLKDRKKRRPIPTAGLELEIEAVTQTLPASDDIDRERLQLALDQLPDDYKIAVTMFYFEQISYKEIAEELQIPIGTVMSRLSRAKTHLRRRLTGSEDSGHGSKRHRPHLARPDSSKSTKP